MLEIQDGPPPDQTGDGEGRPEGPPRDDNDQPGMDPQEAIAIIQKLGIPKEALPILAKAIDALQDAGVIPDADAEQAPPQRPSIDDAFQAAVAKHGLPAGAQ
jgi:hypothetical protein